MDTLAFRLVWPMRRLTEAAVQRHMRSDAERLSPYNAKLIQRYGLLDGVDYDAMLSLLTNKARGPLTPVDFSGLRQTLQAVHRFPLCCAAAKRDFESALFSSVLATPVDRLASAEFAALWAFAAQLSEWRDVARLADAFPLRRTLHLQSDSEFRATAEHMLVVANESTNENANANANANAESSRGIRMLRELVGATAALDRAAACVSEKTSASGADSLLSFAEREAAVGTLVGVAAALGEWPRAAIPDENAWSRCCAPRPASLHVVDLHFIRRLLSRVDNSSGAVPAFARAAIAEALSADLWRCYAELPMEPVAVFFTELRNAADTAPMRAAHENAAARFGRSAAQRLPLARSGKINVFIGSACLRAAATLTAAAAADVRTLLEANAGPPLAPLEAAAIAVALERIAEADDAGSEMKVCAEKIGRCVEPLLRCEVLRERGCSRCVARLLCDCPAWTRQHGLEEGCHKVLREHAGDGFTEAQLQRLLSDANLPEDLREIVAQRITETPSR